MNGITGLKNEKNFGNYFLLGVVVAACTAFILMIRVFLLPMTLAVVIAIMVRPLYGSLLKLTKNRRSLSSLICCAIAVIVLLLPLAVITDMLISQGVELYRSAGPQIDEMMQKIKAGAAGRIVNSYAEKWFLVQGINIELKPILLKTLDYLVSAAPNILNRFSRSAIELAFNSFIIIFSLFYFLRDGERLVLKIRDLVPISIEYKEKIIDGFNSMSSAIIRGVFFIALLQGILATITLWVFGIKAWLLWGTVTLVLSVVPVAGPGVILVPAGIIKIVTGDVWQGAFMILISVFIISLVDNAVRPRIIGHTAGMHDLLVFFSIIGGIFTFGPSGVVIGPLIAAVFLTMVKIYKIEFQSRINASEN